MYNKYVFCESMYKINKLNNFELIEICGFKVNVGAPDNTKRN